MRVYYIFFFVLKEDFLLFIYLCEINFLKNLFFIIMLYNVVDHQRSIYSMLFDRCFFYDDLNIL